ncbi:8784_t:CDS:2, partial [Ambispora gerdemannii]
HALVVINQSCNATRFKKAFSTWTSGNAEIDYFIKNTQINAWNRILKVATEPFFALKEGRIVEWNQHINKWRGS